MINPSFQDSTDIVYPDLCSHFGECGGCASQDIPYIKQLVVKELYLRELYSDFWHDPIPVVASPVVWHYRNKVDPAFAPMYYDTPPPPDFKRDTVLGFKRKGKWFWPLAIEECRIGPVGMDLLVASVNDWYRSEGLDAFDSRKNQGFLRNLLIRDAKRTGQRMVVVITHTGVLPAASFIDAVQAAWPADSIYHGINTEKADVAIASEMTLLAGNPVIEERLVLSENGSELPFVFRISPFSFFQTNPLATERLYAAIRSWVRDIAPDILYDLYGGMGGIAFSCADLVEEVISVECVASASEDGRMNAQENNIGNVTFLTAPVEKYLRALRDGEGMPSNTLVILDPARSGLHPKAIKYLLEMLPEHILYVSCNPKLLARELPLFIEAYQIEKFSAFDLFPHTPHVEALVSLRRRQAQI